MGQYWKIACDGCRVSREFHVLKIDSMRLSREIKEAIGDFVLRHVYCGPAKMVCDESGDPAYDYTDERCVDGHDWESVNKSTGGHVFATCRRCGDMYMPIAEWDRLYEASWLAQQAKEEQS